MYAYPLHKGWPHASFSPLPRVGCPTIYIVSVIAFWISVGSDNSDIATFDHNFHLNTMQNFHVIRRTSSRYCPRHRSRKFANVSDSRGKYFHSPWKHCPAQPNAEQLCETQMVVRWANTTWIAWVVIGRRELDVCGGFVWVMGSQVPQPTWYWKSGGDPV